MKDNPFDDPFASNTKNNNIVSRSTNASTVDNNFYERQTPTDASDFFAEFNDNFNKNKTETAAFDAFGETDNKVFTGKTTTVKPSTSKVKPDHFEDEFGRIKFKNDLNDFARFDAFNEASVNGSSKSFEDTFSDIHSAFDIRNKPKKERTDVGSAFDSKNAKFEADYSKGETFDKDLNEILKRSLVDQ